MDFAPSESERRWHDAAAAFGAVELDDGGDLDRDDRREFWREGWARCARFGLTGLPIPESYGGRGLGLSETIAAMEGLGYACRDNGLIFALNASMWTVSLPILRFGTEAQKSRWLPGLCDGSILGANGASEPEAGSDVHAMRATAARDGDDWVLDGRKTWVTSAPIADVVVAYAATEPGGGVLGLGAFLVPTDVDGFEVVRSIPRMGLRTVPMGEIAFDRCRLPADALLGRADRGAEVFRASMDWERGAILAGAIGTMRRQLERCVRHARSRTQFGQAIGKFQSVSNRIVDMSVRLETGRLLVRKIGWLHDRGDDASAASAMAKLHVSEAFVQNGLDAVRVLGASGYATEGGVERDLRDAVGSLIYSGTNDVQRNILARSLRL